MLGVSSKLFFLKKRNLYYVILAMLIIGCNSEGPNLPPETPPSETPPSETPPNEKIEYREYVHIKAKHDSWIRRGNDLNNGDWNYLYVYRDELDSTSDSWFADSVMKFELSTLPDMNILEEVNLVFDVKFINSDLTPITLDVYSISNDWEEMSVSGVTPLDRGQHLGSLDPEEMAEGTAYLDVTDFIKNNKLEEVSFLLTAENSVDVSAAHIYSQYVENGNQRAPHLSAKVDESKLLKPTEIPAILKRYLASDYSDTYYLNDWSLAGFIEPIKLYDIDDLPVFNVEDFGAVAGIHLDNRKAVQDAIDAAEEAGGGIVAFKEGTYDFNIVSQDASTPLTINSSKVILRGEGSQTVLRQFFSARDSLQKGTATPHFINIVGQDLSSAMSNELLKDASPGSKKVLINNKAGLKAGDVVVIHNFNRNSSKPLAAVEVIEPLVPFESWSNLNRYTSFSHVNRIENIEATNEGTLVTLEAKIPFSFKTEYYSDMRMANKSLNHSGIENMKISMVMPENYFYNHSSDEPLHYENAAIRFSHVSNSWVNNVELENFTQNVTLNSSNFNELRNIRLISTGGGGHHGLGLYFSSHANLISDIDFDAYFVHHISYNGHSNGNVVARLDNEDYKKPTMIDFHGGGLPSFNLIENSNNILVKSSGSIQNMPHAGTRNTFWNVNASGGEFFAASSGWNSSNSEYDSNGFDHYKLHPRSIIVGARSTLYGTLFSKQPEQHASNWYYLEALNVGEVTPLSLYLYQRGN